MSDLDERVAREVMGWSPPPEHGAWRWRDAESRQRFSVPSFSTDISAAWRVVERMQCKGYWFDISATGSQEDPGDPLWLCKIDYKVDGEWRHACHYSPSVALAICLAALAAAEGE